MGFDFASLFFHNPPQLALHCFECVMDDFFERFVGAVIHLSFVGDKFMAWRHGDVDSAPIGVTFVMIVIGLLDGDIAAVNVITKSLESCRVIQNETVDLVRFFQTSIRYLNRQLHSYLNTTVLAAIEEQKISVPHFFKFAARTGNG